MHQVHFTHILMEYLCSVYRDGIIGLIVLSGLFEHTYKLSQVLFGNSYDQGHVLSSEICLKVNHLPVKYRLIDLFEILQEADKVACNLEAALTDKRDDAYLLCIL